MRLIILPSELEIVSIRWLRRYRGRAGAKSIRPYARIRHCLIVPLGAVPIESRSAGIATVLVATV
jgi:hypothetical protein